MQMESEDSLLKKGFGSHLYDIEVPKGTRGTMIDKMKENKDDTSEKDFDDEAQNELLLDRGTRFQITGLEPLLGENGEKLKNQFRILMKVVSQRKKE